MELSRRTLTVYTLLAAVWALVAVWQAEEHYRFRAAAKADLSTRSRVIANTVSACIRGMRFRGTVLRERLEPVLNELVNGRTNELVGSSELTSIVLLNAAGEKIASAGREIDVTQKDLLQQGEHWGQRNVTFVNLVDLGAGTTWEGGTNPTVVLPAMHDLTNRFPEGLRSRQFPRREPGGEPPPPPPDGPPPSDSEGGLGGASNKAESNGVLRTEADGKPREGAPRMRRPPWLRGLSDADYQSLVQNLALHDLVLAMSIDSFHAASTRDLWLRLMIVFLATLSAFGSGVAWRNLVTSSDLQIRLVRASELNTHLKEMNLAAAGLAHETRNPLNIIRGLAQMISRQPEAAPEIQVKSREIVNEADKVAAQLNEFINYSRPREVRPSVLGLGSLINDVVRTLSYDLEEKGIRLEILGEPLTIEADEQMLRQALFNLLLNAIQAVDKNGSIQILAQRPSATEGSLEVRDDGPGVPAERRMEIFKPYFTTQKTGTGLGLAVVQQIVLAHGWEIECAASEPKGAVFRISHLKIKS
jgi:signal transduction histidine kinase